MDLYNSYRADARFRKMKQRADVFVGNRELSLSASAGVTNLEVPFSLQFKRLAVDGDATLGGFFVQLCGSCSVVGAGATKTNHGVNAGARTPSSPLNGYGGTSSGSSEAVIFTSGTLSSASGGKRAFLEFRGADAAAVSLIYKTHGGQSLHVHLMQERGSLLTALLPCCQGDRASKGTARSGKVVGTCKINLGLTLKDLLANEGAQPVKVLPIFGSGGVRVGELHCAFATPNIGTLSNSTELLLHALIANAEAEPECLQAALDILEDGEGLNVHGYREPACGNSLLHVACHHGQSRIAMLLIDEYQMPLQLQNRNGQTPIVAAISNYKDDSTKMNASGVSATRKTSSTSLRQNVSLACTLALRIGEVQALFDAVDGAQKLGLLDSEPQARACLDRLATLLQAQLDSEDEQALSQAIELAQGISKDSPLGQMLRDEMAVKRLVTLQLRKALAADAGNDREKTLALLSQALMAARQHQQDDKVAEYKEAFARWRTLKLEKMRAVLGTRLDQAVLFQDIQALMGVVSYGEELAAEAAKEGVNYNVDQDLPQLRAAREASGRVMGDLLRKAVRSESEQRISTVLSQCRQFSLVKAVGGAYEEAKRALEVDLPHKKCLRMLEEVVMQTVVADSAAQGSRRPSGADLIDEEKMGRALNLAVSLKLQDHVLYTQAIEAYRTQRNLPKTWDVLQFLRKDEAWKPDITAEGRIRQVFQDLVDATFVRKYTRDRKGQVVPQSLRVMKVIQVQQPSNYLNYVCRRDEIFGKITNKSNASASSLKGSIRGYNTLDAQGVKTFRARQQWADALGLDEEPIAPGLNEFYLWHGTRPEAAHAITNADFRVDLAGSHAGTLYGRGVYFAEACSKSDEYTEADTNKYTGTNGLRPLLLCRVSCGNVLYTDQMHPNVDDLVKQCTRGEYNCVLGDREKCRNTFREFIVYDNHQCYPEYIIWYSRSS
ncbi:unnamed protein product [Amoebophrya sp. A25]|nr:unnamed protein product [Amoebophrya sp. A25]|eukprot:GSA25T00022628001.1